MEFITIKALEEIADKLLSVDWIRQQEILSKTVEACYYKMFIDEACSWLKDNIMLYVYIVGNDAYIDKDKLLQDFRNSIKSETTS